MKGNKSLKSRAKKLLGANPNRNRCSKKNTEEGVVKKICYFIIHILTNIFTFIVNIFKKNTPKHMGLSNRQRRKLSVEKSKKDDRRNPFGWCA